MAKRVSQVGIPSEIAALAPLSLGQGSQQGRELEIAGASLVELGVLLHKKKVATDVANGTAAYNELFDKYAQQIAEADKDKPISPDAYVPGYEKILAKNKGKIFKGMSRDAVDVLNNKFVVKDQMNKAILARAAIARRSDLALDAYARQAISFARSGTDSREDFEETLLNDTSIKHDQRKALLGIYDKEEIRIAAKSFVTLDESLDFIEAQGAKAGLSDRDIAGLIVRERDDRNRAKLAETEAVIAVGKTAMNIAVAPQEPGAPNKWTSARNVYDKALADGLLTEAEYTSKIRNLNTVSNLVANGKPNPMEVTTNWGRYKEMRKLVIGNEITEAEIYQNVGVHNPETNTGGIGKAEALLLTRMIETGGTGKDFRDSATAETFTNRLDADEFLIAPLAKEQGLRWLEIWSKEHPDATQLEADEQALRVYERVVREDTAGTLPATATELREVRVKAEAEKTEKAQRAVWDGFFKGLGMNKANRILALNAMKEGKSPEEIVSDFRKTPQASGRIIVNPTTGERRRWDGTKWVTL